MDEMLTISNLKKSYGHSRGVENVNFGVRQGEIFGFIGPNGAGKSTTIRCVMNMINYQAGEIVYRGEKLTPKSQDLYQEIGYLPGEIHLYKDYTVLEMLKYNSRFYQKETMDRAQDLAHRLDLDLNKKIGALSLGNLKKVGVVLSLMHRPKFVIMDEATSGLDPLMQEEFYKIIIEEKKRGTTFLFSSHNLSEVRKICDRVAIIKEGRVIAVSRISDLVSDSLIVHIKTSDDFHEQVKIIERNNDEIVFLYSGNPDQLVKMLAHYQLDKVSIEEPSLEEVFMHFYR